MDYEKIRFYIGLAALAFLALFCTGCVTNGNAVAGDTFAAGQLEATIRELDRTTADSRKRIEDVISASRNLGDGIDRLEYLFTEYEREVRKLQTEIERIRDKAEAESKMDSDTGAS